MGQVDDCRLVQFVASHSMIGPKHDGKALLIYILKEGVCLHLKGGGGDIKQRCFNSLGEIVHTKKILDRWTNSFSFLPSALHAGHTPHTTPSHLYDSCLP
jgi:hypothetical protein